MIKILLFQTIFLLTISYSQTKAKLEYKGDIQYITQSKNHISLVTQNSPTQNHVYVIDK